MQHGDVIKSIHESMASAIHRDLPDVEYETKQWKDNLYSPLEPREFTLVKRVRRPYGSEVSVLLFEQMWGSTALGYGGIGGAAMTNAYTTIVSYGEYSCVYFGEYGTLAYLINCSKFTLEQERYFDKCISEHNMPDVRTALNKFKGAIEGKEDEF